MMASTQSHGTCPGHGLVVASSNGRVGIGAAVQALRDGGSALDAVEAGIRLVESNTADNSVGLGGLPNILGVVELDASIMDGTTLKAGAVGAVRKYEHVISLARRVMEELPHVMLVGPGAERFAAEVGMKPTRLLTAEACASWLARVGPELRPEVPQSSAEVRRAMGRRPVRECVRRLAISGQNTGTVNMLARDGDGHIASGVSTSGWESKYPGRLGDSPVIGAGSFADNRYGAAACTGNGELAIRCALAHSVVLGMKTGLGIETAVIDAITDARSLCDPLDGGIDVIGIDPDGRFAAATSGYRSDPFAQTFVFQSIAMKSYVERERVKITEIPNAS
jgi:L-asparaginase / beta-aspartyl-peptidase